MDGAPPFRLPLGRELLKGAFVTYRQNIRVLAPILAVSCIGGILPLAAPESGPTSLLVGLAAALVSFAAYLALLYTIVMGEPSVKVAFSKGLSFVGPYIWITVLAALAVAGGLLLIVVPGVILGILLSFTAYILIAERRHGLSALVQSWHYVRGRLGQVVLRDLFILVVFIPVYAVTVLPGFLLPATSPEYVLYSLAGIVIATVTWPIALIYNLGILNALKGHAGEPAPEEAERIERNIRRFIGLGLIFCLLILVAAGYLAMHPPAGE